MAPACAGGAEARDGSARAAGLGGRRRSVYLRECVPLWGRASTRGQRKAMEDASAAMPHFADVPVRMLASARELDALGRPVGVDASAAMHLEALSRAAAARGLEGELELGGIQELWEKAFCECFDRVDDEVSGEATIADGVGEEARRREPVAADNVGSTAAVALVCSSHVIVANCGDSRVVLCSGKEPVALSVDHKPDREDERARIEAAGGEIINWHGNRVAGVLAMSRRQIHKTIYHSEVRVVARTKGDDCLILASDGLWDVISNEDACRAARLQILRWHKENDGTRFGEGGDKPTISDPASQAAADYLVRLALLKGSQDNITVTVIDLRRRKMVKDIQTK